ncbi:MAG: hypothetical protein J1E05_03200 [Eubacterium sp.]|nr:hypothetical protein [Eubacterium sp.]
MKTTYIITPFKSSAYLVRCVNSILRQTDKNNEIIVAENFFETSQAAEFLGSVEGIKFISKQPRSDFDKIKEAISLADDESHINFLSVDTVAVPIASQTIAGADADIIAVSYAVRNGGAYSATMLDKCTVIDSAKINLQSLFIRKKHLENISLDSITERTSFGIWIDKKITEGVTCAVLDELCFYLNVDALGHDANAEYCLKDKAAVIEIATSAIKANSNEGFLLFDKYISMLYNALFSKKYASTVKSDIFYLIKELLELSKDNAFAKRVYELYFGADIELICNMTYEMFSLYNSRILSPVLKTQLEQVVDNRLAPVKNSISSLNTALTSITSSLNALNSGQKAQKETIEGLEKNLKTVKKGINTLKKSALASEPKQQVPILFRKGKLGFVVLIKSSLAWLKRKLSRKSK